MIKKILLLSISFSIFSCGSYNPEPEVNDLITFKPSKENGMGLLVVDFGEQEPNFEQGGLYYKPIDSNDKGIFRVYEYKGGDLLPIKYKYKALTNPKLGIETKKRYVYLLTFECKANKYDFFNFYFSNQGYMYSQRVSSNVNFSLPFEITNNKINYLGELHINQYAFQKKSNQLPFVIIDNFDKNIKMFKEKYKYLYLENVENKTIKEELGNTGIFIFK